MSPNIIVKKYEHFNRTMGCYIKSRAHYEKEMQKRGFVDWETGERMVQEAKKNKKDYNGLSDKAMGVIKSAWQQKDKKGNLKASDKLIDGMKECGVSFDACQWVTSYDKHKGGFDEK